MRLRWLAAQRLGASSKLRIVDAILSGTHERGTSHYELLRAFVDDEILGRIDQELNARDYRTHEFGDSVFLERAANRTCHSAHPSVATCLSAVSGAPAQSCAVGESSGGASDT